MEFRKNVDTKFHENPSDGRRVVHGDGRADTTKLIVAFRNFANAPETAACNTSQQETEQFYE